MNAYRRDVRFAPESGHLLAKRFNKLSKLNCFLRADAVPVITVPLALWRTTACTVHPADLPASHRRSADPSDARPGFLKEKPPQ
jgi:hypothetical protein